MNIERKTTEKTSLLALLIMAFYILMSYTANDILISRSWNSYALYVFLFGGVIFTLKSVLENGLEIPYYTMWYFIFMIVSMTTMLYSPERAFFSGQYYLMIVSFILTFFLQMIVRNKQEFIFVCWCYAISSACLVAILYFTGNLVGTDSERLGKTFLDNSNNFAGIVMAAVIYSLWLFVYAERKLILKMVLLCIVALDMYALVLSAGRKFFVVPFIFLYVMLLLKKDKKGKKKFFLYSVLIAILVLIVWNLIMEVDVFYDAIGIRFERLISGQDGSGAIRSKMIDLAMTQWTKRPLIGYGFDSFKYYAQVAVGQFFYSHCNYTELLYNGGIILFGVYYWVYYKIIATAIRLKNYDNSLIAFAVASAVSLFVFDYGSVSYSLTFVQTILMFSLKLLFMAKDNGLSGQEL